MPDFTEAQKKQEFNENFEIMNESAEGTNAFKETFADQTNAENLLATGGGENLGSIESELASLAVMNEIRLSQRQEAFVESSLFTTKVDLKVRNKSFLDGTGEIGRRKAIKSHRYDKTRKNRAETANETMTRANDKIRILQKKLRGENGADVPDILQKVSALEEIYDNIRIADRNFAEALSLNKAEENKLKDKAELTYRASLKRMYEREMEGLDHNSREYIKIKRKYDDNLRVYNELKGAMQQAQGQAGAQEHVHADARENQVLPAANQEAEAVLEPVDKEAEELVSKNVELFKKFAEKFDDDKYSGKVIPAWNGLKQDVRKLVDNWDKLKDFERGHLLGEVMISANKVLAAQKEDGGVGKERLSAAKTCRNFFKTILNSMSDNCRILALDEIFKVVDKTEQKKICTEALIDENKALFAEMSRDLLENNGQLEEAEKNKDFVIEDFYRAQYALDKYRVMAENVKKVFGNTKDFAIASMKFRFNRCLSHDMLCDNFRLDRYGRVVEGDEGKVEQWRKLFSEMANCDTAGALKFQREFFTRVGQTPVDKTFASKDVLRKKYYEFKSFSIKATNTSDFANYFEDMTPESIKRKVDAWNAQHPEDKISEKDIKILDKNKLLEQNEKLAALPVFDVMRKVMLSLDHTGFVSHLIIGKGMAIGSDVKLNDEEKLKNIDNAIDFVLTGKEVTFNWSGPFCPLIHKDGTAFDPENDTKEITDPKDRTKRIRVLKQNEKNRLVLSMDYYQVKAKEEIKKQAPVLDKAKNSMEVMEKRQAQLYTVENGAMDRLRALCTNKLSAEGKAELKKLEATFEEFLCDASIELLEMEKLDQSRIKTSDGTQAEFSHRSRIYDAHKKKMEAIYKKIDAAQRSFIKKYASEAAYKSFKKELDLQRGASEEKKEKFVKVTTSKDAASTILEGNYDNIEQVKLFKKNMGNLYSLLSNKMPPLSFDNESVDATCLLVATVYNDVITSIDACLRIKKSVIKNDDFFKQMEKVKELCVKEKALFRQNVFEYREMLAQSDELDEEYQNPTWLHAIKYLRAEHYNINNKKGIKTEIKGSGASIRYKMTEKKDGEENTMWFSKEEKVASDDTTTLFTEYVDSLDFDEAFKERAIKPVFDALLNDFRMKPFIGDQPILRFIVGLRTSEPGEIIQSMRAAGLDAEQEFSKLSDEDKKVVSTQLKEFSKHIFQREICAKSAKIDYGRNISNRNVATSRMAQLFGIQNIISDSRTATVQNGNTTIMGNVMEDAKGFKASDVTNKAGNKVVYGENAINQTFCMMVFDLICGQVDRHFANFYMQFDKDEKKKVTKITGIKAFDNDVAFGRLTFNDVKEGYNRIRPATHLHLKGLPISMVNTIMHLEREVIDHLLCDILDKKELDALWNRLSGIKNRIPQLEGIAYNEETHRYYYTGEDADDTLRQLKQLKGMTKVFPGEEITEYTSFHHTLVSPRIIDQMIAQRRKELGINTR